LFSRFLHGKITNISVVIDRAVGRGVGVIQLQGKQKSVAILTIVVQCFTLTGKFIAKIHL
jgi:hypothetical protein